MNDLLTTFQPTPPVSPDNVTTPHLVHSSQLLGWHGVEAQLFLAPHHLEGWVEPVVPDVTLILLTCGTMWLEQRVKTACAGLHIPQEHLLLKPADMLVPALNWHNLSAVPTQALYIRLSRALFSRTLEKIADRDLPASDRRDWSHVRDWAQRLPTLLALGGG
jgi:hypothetical protein